MTRKLALLLLLIAAPTVGWAADPSDFIVGPWAFRRLEQAHQALEKNQLSGALKALNEMKSRRGISDHEKALMWQTFGFVYAAQGKTGQAISSFEKAISKEMLPPTTLRDIRYNLGQLHLSNGNSKSALKFLLSWLKEVESPGAGAYYLVAVAYEQQKDLKRSLTYATRAVNADASSGHLQLLLSVQYRLGKKREATQTLLRLINRQPQGAHWTRLAALYAELGDNKRALAALDIANISGALTRDSELTLLAQMQAASGAPLLGAQVLERGLETKILKKTPTLNRQLAQMWLAARDDPKALKALTRAAADKSDGQLWLEIGQLHQRRQAWREAAKAFQKALSLGGVEAPGQVYLMLGIARLRANQLDEARRSFSQAQKHKASKKEAEGWLTFLSQLAG